MIVRKQIFEAWRSETRSGISREFPSFVRYTQRPTAEERERAFFSARAETFVSTLSGSLSCFLSFRPLDEGFDSVVGWSKSGRFAYGGLDIVAGNENKRFDLDQPYFFTAPQLLAGLKGAMYWSFWNASSEDPQIFAQEYARYALMPLTEQSARDLVKPSIMDAISLIEKEVIPYFEAVSAQAKGGANS